MASSDDLLELARIFYDYTKSPRVEKLITRLESQGEAEDATPPPADEVSEETLRSIATCDRCGRTDLAAFEGRRCVWCRSAEDDLATARHERDEARAEAGRLRRVMEDVQHGASAALATTTEEPKP